jgi:ribosomal protein S18 acetylase RimI-like enzyme
VEADAAALAELAERTFRDTFAAHNDASDVDLCCAEHFGEPIQLEELRDPNMVSLLAEVDGRLVGYVQVKLSSPQECVPHARPSEIHRLYVSAEAHGTGVAQSLMREAVALARQAGADSVWLGVWEHNPRAIAFYGKFRLEVVGAHTFVFGSDPQRDLIMAMSLEANPGDENA